MFTKDFTANIHSDMMEKANKCLHESAGQGGGFSMERQLHTGAGAELERVRSNRSRKRYPFTRPSKAPGGGASAGHAYRICSKRRFAALLLVVAALSFLAGFAFAEKPVRAAAPPVYAEVEIQDGDTLWQIAAAYRSEGQDIRRLIYDICRINGIDAGSIQAGRMILVPVRK
jgi:hypothetical protein